MKILPVMILALLVLLPSCIESKKVPGNPTVTEAAKKPSAQKPVADARGLSKDADKHRDAAGKELSALDALLEKYKGEEYQELKNLVTKLRNEGVTSNDQLELLVKYVYDQEQHIIAFLGRIDRIGKELGEEKKLRQLADEQLVKATAAIAAKDTEADQLRQQFRDQKLTSAAFEKNAQDNFKAAQSAKSAADKAKGARNTWIKIAAGIGALLLLSLGANYLQLKGIL